MHTYMCAYIYLYIYVHIYLRSMMTNVVSMISRLLQMIGLFCRIQSLLYGSFAKETYIFICMCKHI